MSLKDLWDHLLEKNIGEFICCGRIFHNKKRFYQHLKIHYQKTTFVNSTNENCDANLNETSDFFNISAVELNELSIDLNIPLENNAFFHQNISTNDYKIIFIKTLTTFLCKSTATRQFCFQFGAETLEIFQNFLKLILKKHNLTLLDQQLNDFFESFGGNQSMLSQHKFFLELKNLNVLVPFQKVSIDLQHQKCFA